MAKTAAKKPARKNGAKKQAAPRGGRFPNESANYRSARNALLKAEVGLRREVERVAALRRKLPAGGAVPDDYVFEEIKDGETRRVKLSELFGDKPTLVVYNFMYGPTSDACPMCTSMLDAMDGETKHVFQRVSFAVVAKSPIERIRAYARDRGWRGLRLLSSAKNSFNRDYFGESADGGQRPMLNVFVKKGGKIHHFYGTELLFAPHEAGQDNRHIDMIWPLWNLLDLTPEGRGKDWRPRLNYGV
ncbi:MAG TPA: DUF899 family protein [Xanthobacteraceae bacterium]|nr:DUF899 family protein [Xanthobacteraceae bacterium]